MYNVLFIMGVSGSGKNYIQDLLSRKGNEYDSNIFFNKTEQVTTRKPRSKEEIAKHTYEFINKEQYELIKSALVAKTYFNDNYYGTKISSLRESSKNNIIINTIVVDINGYKDAINEFNKIFENNYFSTIIKILCDNPEKRETRNKEFLRKEMESLIGLPGYVFENDVNNRIKLEDIMKISKEFYKEE